MERITRFTSDPVRMAAFASGIFYLITFASSIPAALLLAPILTDPSYIVGTGADSQILLACVLDLVNALTAVGSAVAVFSILRRRHEGFALGFVTTRMFEAATIVVGVVSLLAVVSIRQAGPAAGTDDTSLIAVGQGLVGVRDWTFIVGPGMMPGFNALMFATVLYRTRLVPRLIPALGLIGGPMLIASATGMILGIHELGSPFSALATLPIFVWELSVGLWMAFKGFNRNAPMFAGTGTGSGTADEAAGTRRIAGTPGTAAPRAAATSAAPVSSRFARFRFRPVPRHLLVLVGLWLAIVANAEAEHRGVGIALIIAFSILPRMPLLLGIGRLHAPSRLAALRVPLFNVLNEPVVPVAVFGLGVIGALPGLALVGGLAWLGQVVIGWGLGDGLRQADGSVRPAPARWASWPTLPGLGRTAVAS